MGKSSCSLKKRDSLKNIHVIYKVDYLIMLTQKDYCIQKRLYEQLVRFVM